jgi:hypothetical protein
MRSVNLGQLRERVVLARPPESAPAALELKAKRFWILDDRQAKLPEAEGLATADSRQIFTISSQPSTSLPRLAESAYNAACFKQLHDASFRHRQLRRRVCVCRSRTFSR